MSATMTESKVPEHSEFSVSYKGFVHCDSKTRIPDEITIEGLHEIFTTKKLMKQAQSDNPLAGRGFKKPVTLSIDRDEIRLAQSGSDDGSDLYNTHIAKIVLSKEIDSNVYIIVRRTKQNGKFACHCLSTLSKAKSQESDRIAKTIMHWVRMYAAEGDSKLKERSTVTGDDGGERPSALSPTGRAWVSDGASGGSGGAGAAVDASPIRSLPSPAVSVGTASAASPSGASSSSGPTHASGILSSMIWYHGVIDRRAAVTILDNEPVGAFLVRYSDKKQEYCLSIVTVRNIVQHFVTVSGPDGRVSLQGHKNQYDSVIQLVDHYSKFDITSDGDRCRHAVKAVR
eukprot:m.173563 g.173563  ORF g.173563 m.173563 type:complete len:342 (+) comp13713_c0_seq1:228-1253(+)